MDVLATGKGWLAAVSSVSSSTVIISSTSSRGRYRRRQGVGRGLSSHGTIARPGSGSRSPGIGRWCLAAVTGGAAAGFSAAALWWRRRKAACRQAGEQKRRDRPAGSGAPQASQPGAVTETSPGGVGVFIRPPPFHRRAGQRCVRSRPGPSSPPSCAFARCCRTRGTRPGPRCALGPWW